MRCHLLHGPACAVATNLADTDQKGMGDGVGHVAAHCSGSHSSGHVGEAQVAGVHPSAASSRAKTQFNHERPHQALDMRLPGELYVRSPRPYTGLAPLAPPDHPWSGLAGSYSCPAIARSSRSPTCNRTAPFLR